MTQSQKEDIKMIIGEMTDLDEVANDVCEYFDSEFIKAMSCTEMGEILRTFDLEIKLK